MDLCSGAVIKVSGDGLGEDLDRIVEQVEALAQRRSRGEIDAAEYQRASLSLWTEWLTGPAPEARVLAQVLAAIGEPDTYDRVHAVWADWLRQVREEEGQ